MSDEPPYSDDLIATGDRGLVSLGPVAINPKQMTTLTIMGADGRDLLVIHTDGRVEGSLEDASEAAAAFVRSVRWAFGQPVGGRLDADRLFDADAAFLSARAQGQSDSLCVREAIRAYLTHVPVAAAPADTQQTLIATLPAEYYPAFHPGTQVLVRSFDGGATWEVAARHNEYSTWGLGVELEPAP